MKETMGQIIKRLRRERNLTQEELAEQLSISAPAVSKWENDTSMPDISQVVPLANLFGVPTDVLFGVYGTDHSAEIEARLKEIYSIYDGCPDGEEGPVALVILDKYREAIRLYPNNATILTEAIAFAVIVLQNNESALTELIGKEGVVALADEAVRWAETVIKYSTSIDSVLSAKRGLIDIYVYRKNWDAAFAVTDSFPLYVSDTRSVRQADLCYRSGEAEKEKNTRCGNIVQLVDELGSQVATLGNLYTRQGQYEDALYCYSFLRSVADTLYGEESYRPTFIRSHYPMYRFPAECLVKLGQPDAAVDMLTEGVDFILAQAEDYNKKTELDNPLLRGCFFSYGHDSEAKYGDLSEILNSFVSGGELTSLADHPRYKALTEKITFVE